MLTLRPQDLPEVRAALRRYRKAVQALDRKALVGVRVLRARIGKEKAQRKRGRQ
jgi:hypothetical protein